jgi:NAD(P)-dependent dehydrogenase (short-subunit alcohol dehydrogenase family)
MSFANRTVMITGAAGHLGRAVAEHFAHQDARLVLLDRHLDALGAVAVSAGDRLPIECDLLDAPQCRQAVAAAVERFGRIDALCHLAGGFRMGQAVHETTDATWDLLFDLNARSFVNIGRAIVPHLIERGGGRIVTVGAASAQKGLASMGAYCASKSSLIRLTEAMSAELRERRVNVNCVLPTIIDTPDNRAAMPDVDPARWVSPAALAEVIAFLVSDAARAIHGAALPVPGLS